MIKFLLSSILLIITFIPQEPIWREYVSYEGVFKVKVPGDMKEVVQSVETSMGELEYHTFVYRDNNEDADNLIYMISYVDYPEGSIHSDSVDLVNEFLDVSIEESVTSINGKLIYSNDFKIHDYTGKIWRVDYGNNSGVIRTKAFVKESRFYTIQTACIKDKSLNSSSDIFFDSFKLLDKMGKIKMPKKKLKLNGTAVPKSPY